MRTLQGLRSVAERDPYDYFAHLRAEGDVVWDGSMNAWVATTYSACMEVMKLDKKDFRHPWSDMAAASEAFKEIEGPQINLTHGEEHARFHGWWLKAVSPAAVDAWRPALLQPIVNSVIDRFAARGSVELVAEFAEQIPVRVIAAIMDLPWQDDDWIAHCKELMDRKMAFLDAFGNDEDGSITANAVAAVREMRDMLTPYIEARRGGEGQDLISLLWRDGPEINPSWGEEEMFANAEAAFFAGTDTTTHAICNGLHMLMHQPELQDELRAGGRSAIEAFTEELLRLYGAIQFRPRLANRDITIAGAEIKKDQLVISLHSAANRDPERFAHPDEVDLARKPMRRHLAFSFGPRVCGGAALARGEIQEATRAVLTRLPGLRPDPGGPSPEFAGLILRSYRPLPAVFDVPAGDEPASGDIR